MTYAIPIKDIFQLINQDVVLIDIRDIYQYRQQHIQNFINIPYDQIKKYQFSYDKPIYLLCSSGEQAKKCALELRQLNYQAYYIEGGMKAFLSVYQNKYF